jgi:uncharacterized membrane protein YozB (DUF420 family)
MLLIYYCTVLASMVTYLQVHEWMAQANIVIQTAILILIVLAIFLQKRRKTVWHGNLMLTATLVTGLLLVAHMGPTFLVVLNEGIREANWVAFLGIAHGVTGAAGLLLAVWLTGMWTYLGTETGYCTKRKKAMRRILAFWVISISLGYVYYVAHLVWT